MYYMNATIIQMTKMFILIPLAIICQFRKFNTMCQPSCIIPKDLIKDNYGIYGICLNLLEGKRDYKICIAIVYIFQGSRHMRKQSCLFKSQ